MKNTGRKTHWLRTTLIVLILCGLVGVVIAGIGFTKTASVHYASSVLEMNFSAAANGLAPNGNPFDIQDIASEEVLRKALEASSLSDAYTPEQIRPSLQIRGIYPENLLENYTKNISIVNNTNAGNDVLTIGDYHPTSFSVTLSNTFDTSVSRDRLTSLLENILAAYKAYFAQAGADRQETGTSVFTITDYDYIHQLSLIRERLTNVESHAKEMSKRNPDFRLNGKGFDDISVRTANLIAGDLSRIESTVTVNALSKDKGRLLEQYQYMLNRQNDTLKSKKEILEKMDKLIESYGKNATIYISTSSSLNEIRGNSSATYDKIVTERKKIAEEITGIQKSIEGYQKKIADITGGNGTAEQKVTEAAGELPSDAAAAGVSEGEKEQTAAQDEAILKKVEADLDLLISKERKIVEDFDALLQAENAEQINDLTVRASTVQYKAPSFFSGAFLIRVVKTAGPFCMIGFVVCMLLIFISRRKEEKSK